MVKLIAVFLFTIVGYGCTQTNNKVIESNNINAEVDEQSIDTLNKHKHSVDMIYSGGEDFVRDMIEDTIAYYKSQETFLIHERGGFSPLTIKGFVVDRQKFVAATALGQYLVLYKFIDTAYIRIFYNDNAGMNPLNVKVKFMDINFDGYNDILIADTQGVWGNEFSTTFLYDKESQTFKRAPFLDLRNLTLDKKNKFLRTHSYRGSAWARDKSIYRFVNDTVELTGEAWYIPHESNHDDSLATLKVYLYQNGVAKDSTVQKAKNAWELYLKALWDNSKDYD